MYCWACTDEADLRGEPRGLFLPRRWCCRSHKAKLCHKCTGFAGPKEAFDRIVFFADCTPPEGSCFVMLFVHSISVEIKATSRIHGRGAKVCVCVCARACACGTLRSLPLLRPASKPRLRNDESGPSSVLTGMFSNNAKKKSRRRISNDSSACQRAFLSTPPWFISLVFRSVVVFICGYMSTLFYLS